MHYIIGVKPGDHAFLFQHLRANDEAGQTQHLTQFDPATGVLHHFRWHSGVPLNESNLDEWVTVLEYWEVQANGKVQYFSWITDLPLTEDNVDAVMRGGRARWKIENETFNTLKNQRYSAASRFPPVGPACRAGPRSFEVRLGKPDLQAETHRLRYITSNTTTATANKTRPWCWLC